MKVCRGFCGRSLPLEVYRLRVSGSNERHGTCSECHAASERRRRERKRQAAIGRVAGELGRVQNAEEAQRVVRASMTYFRGPHGLAKALWQTYLAAPAGSVTAAKLLLAIVNLNKVVSPPSPEHEAAAKNSWLP